MMREEKQRRKENYDYESSGLGNNKGRHYSDEEDDEENNKEDQTSTNLYISNISPLTKEPELYRLFYTYGPIASVKIMWPYTEEERSRNRNCGFVAFMDRPSAEKAFKNLHGILMHDHELNVSWGKPVKLPPRPLPPPPNTNIVHSQVFLFSLKLELFLEIV